MIERRRRARRHHLARRVAFLEDCLVALAEETNRAVAELAKRDQRLAEDVGREFERMAAGDGR